YTGKLARDGTYATEYFSASSLNTNGGFAINIGRRCATLTTKPTHRKLEMMLLPPALTKGSVMPVIGPSPMVTKRFVSVWIASIVDMPTAMSRPYGSFV